MSQRMKVFLNFLFIYLFIYIYTKSEKSYFPKGTGVLTILVSFYVTTYEGIS